MEPCGDRAIAGLLSSLAEAADARAAASRLMAQLETITGPRRAGMLHLDEVGAHLIPLVTTGFETAPSIPALPVSDLASPLVIAALGLVTLRGGAALGPDSLSSITTWVAIPMVGRARQGSRLPLPLHRARELAAARGLAVLGGEEQRSGAVPMAVAFFEGSLDERALDRATGVTALAAPVLAAVRALEAASALAGRLERRLRQATADAAERNARLAWQAQEVERANKLKSEFLASMSHELRTPINALIGYSALLMDGVLGDVNVKQSDALARGRAAAEHLLALVDDILDLAKIEAGKLPLHAEPVSLHDVIHEAALQVEPMVRRKALELSIDVPPDCPIILTDRAKVKQVLLNLLSNAVKFTAQGRVSVTVRCSDAGVRIDVADTGIGIRPDDLDAIWEDFRQVDQSRTREFGGTGLGLSITRKLLERLSGSVSVESTYGRGSTFSVTLPFAIPAPAAAAAEPALDAREPG